MAESLTFIEFNHWFWWVLGVTLIVLEILVSGFFLLWAGAAALMIGCVAWMWPALPFPVEIFLFAVLSVGNVWAWRAYQRRYPSPLGDAGLNRRGIRYVGRRLTLENPIVNGRGVAKIDDTTWKIQGPDCPAGTQVVISGVDGSLLKVEPYPKEKEKIYPHST